MSDTNAYARERTNSTHEAYLKRIGVSPIVIPPPQAQQAQHAQHAQQEQHVQRTQREPQLQHIHRQESRGPMQSPHAPPKQEKKATRLPPNNNNLPTGVKGCLCGCIKITGGYLACPIICHISCIAGACHSIYHTMTCDKYNDGTDPHKLCVWFGCYNACVISSTWIEEGIADMQRKPHVETEMVR